MNSVAIFGVGLIGGSFAFALRKAGFAGRIVGVSSPETIARAIERNAIDEGLAPEQAAASADLIYLAQPVRSIVEILPKLNAWARPETLITDAGSSKGVIVNEARRAVTRCQFLGGHPMAGSERRGVNAADADLFRGRPYVVTPQSPADLETIQVRELLGWISAIGAKTIVISAHEHDRLVAYGSHLPQLASTALAALLASNSPESAQLAGPGLVDTTRLALSSYELWRDIIVTNRPAIHEALTGYIEKLEEIRRRLDSGDLEREFECAAGFAGRIRKRQ